MVKNSTSVLVLLGGVGILNSLDCSLSINNEAVNITTKDSANGSGIVWEEFMSGAKNATVSVSGLYADGDLDPVWTAIAAADSVTLKFGNAVSGEEGWSGDAIITSLEIASPGYEGAMTYNASFQMSGEITKADNA